MESHAFVFFPGTWLGQGTITFSESAEKLRFYTRWKVSKTKSKKIKCLQEIEVEGVPEKMENNFIFSDISAEAFFITLENVLLGSVNGKGLVDAKTIAWEFRENDSGTGFEGYEVYELQNDGTYAMRAEYSTDDQMRTIVQGNIWKA